MRFVWKSRRLGLALAAGALCAGFTTGCLPEKAEVDPLEGYRIAVVDLPPLLELHPSYSKLEQLNAEISELQEQKLQIEKESREKLISEGGDEMEQAIAKAKAKLEAEQAAVESEISALSSSLSGQIESEMRGLHAAYEAELKQEIAKISPQAAEPPPPLDGKVEGQVKDYLQNLSMVRERNLAARRLELEKRVGDEIASKKAEVDGQLAAYEADLAAQYQSERLNLQLTAQNSTDEAAKTAAENRLGEIAMAIDEAKSTKRAELEGGYAALRAEKTSALQGELQAYQQKLDIEVSQKLAAKRREIGMAPPVQAQTSPTGPPPEVQAKIREIEGRMKAQLQSKKSALESRMRAKMDESRIRLETKQQEVQANLERLNKEIGDRIEKGLANLPKEIKDKLEDVDQKVEKVQEERKNLVTSMRKDIDAQVAGVAEKKEQKMVLGLTYERNYFYKDPSFEDLTDLSQVRIQQMEKK
jgi:hypothetical protein